jgi:hypothetical protein
VKCEAEFHNAQIGGEVGRPRSDNIAQCLAHLCRQLFQLVDGHLSKLPRTRHAGKDFFHDPLNLKVLGTEAVVPKNGVAGERTSTSVLEIVGPDDPGDTCSRLCVLCATFSRDRYSNGLD